MPEGLQYKVASATCLECKEARTLRPKYTCRDHIIHSFRSVPSKNQSAIARQAIALASADSAPLPAGYQYTHSPATSAMYATPPLDLLDRELSDSQVCFCTGVQQELQHVGT